MTREGSYLRRYVDLYYIFSPHKCHQHIWSKENYIIQRRIGQWNAEEGKDESRECGNEQYDFIVAINVAVESISTR